MLKEEFTVEAISFPPAHDYLNFLKSCIRLPSKIIWCDVVFAWFAGLHTAVATILAKIFGKRIVVVTGGWDVENMPEIDYGAYCHPVERIICGFVFHHADMLLPFSSYAKQKLLTLWKPKAKCVKVDLYCDTKKFYPQGKKENIVLTVGQVKENNLKRKGLENFVMAAKYLPDVKFILVGKFIDDSINYLRSIAPNNVEFTGFLPEEDLIKLYQKAKVYCQLSYQEGEGAGGAVGEAMACECIPYGDHKKTAEIIREALNAPDEMGKKARERIVKLFPPERRKKELKEIMEKIPHDLSR